MDENTKESINNTVTPLSEAPLSGSIGSADSTEPAAEAAVRASAIAETAVPDAAEHVSEADPSDIDKSENVPEEVSENAPAPQNELRLGSRSAARTKPASRVKGRSSKRNNDSFISKLGATLADRSVFGGLIIYIIFIVNIIGMIIYSKRAGLGLTQSILYQLHFDSISFKSFTFLEISVLVSYMVTFILGGLIIFILLKIGATLAELCGFAYSHKFTRWLIFIFMAVFSASALISVLSGSGILTTVVYKSAAPLFTLAGGLVMYCMSLRRIDIS